MCWLKTPQTFTSQRYPVTGAAVLLPLQPLVMRRGVETAKE
jgi:hypothetical protein